MQRSLRRRRRTLGVLLALALVAFAVAVVASQPRLWGVQLVTDVMLVGYLAVLIHLRNVSAGTEMSHRALGS
jgi:predicted acyltransferase